MKKKKKFKSHGRSFGNRKPPSRKRSSSSGANKEKVPLRLLIHHPKDSAGDIISSDRAFSEVGLTSELKSSLDNMGFTHMTPIQKDVWAPIINGKDVLGIAQTGTGKTVGFLLPLIQQSLTGQKIKKILVLVPTRELALQVEDTCQQLLIQTSIEVISFIGGRSFRNDLKNLKENQDVIVATTGRLKALIREGHLSIDQFEVLVLDEYDRMLDMGFHRDVAYVVKRMTSRCQTLLFSATMDQKVRNKASALLQDPVTIKASSGREAAAVVRQDIVRYEPNKKFDKLLDLLVNPALEKVLIFCDTKDQVSRLYDHLDSYAVPVDQIHGDKTQAYRKRALDKFKKGEIRVLVATDVASRGLDIDNVSHVINYYYPSDYETYIHRIGRTGRAGRGGIALTFVSARL